MAVSAQPTRPIALPGENPPEPPSEPPLVDLSTWLRESPPWLASALVHMLLVVMLGLLWVSTDVEKPLVLEVYSEDVGEQLIDEPLELNLDASIEVDEQSLAISPLPPIDDPLAAPEMPLIAPNATMSVLSSPAQMTGVALSGREPGMKSALLKAYGGTKSTEEAVLDGLRWLARNQRSNGSWSLKGPYTRGAASQEDNPEAASAMALLAFQGAGYTHQDPPTVEFSKVVSKGWAKLLKSQDEQGNFFRSGGFNHALYTHAQCTIALCELYAMTHDESLRDPAQKAIDYCVQSQSASGGWRYVPREGADTSVTGWFVMALKSGQMAGLDVPSETFHKAGLFLDKVAQRDGSRYAYQERGAATLSMTAEGLLCRQYLGWTRDDPRLREGVYYLLENTPRWTKRGRNVYYWYYATQVCHHMEGAEWDRWNKVTRQIVPEHQVKSGREKGSWDVEIDEVHGTYGGRLYTTCLSIYILEVYYRHLPIYRQGMLNSF